ncbi:odorant-binding protein 2a-like [Fukomys damarensis]|uniref:odorant-binding protein 2a-like n=1 Tax=Fukomys damarensis TaxID=885580 RepID=UPI00054012DA|nr:odorant-binding protein 2a-like [Fukomys damarensis]XP_010625731.1 odorant-binding protein 2a-like [Fukomys damarensis]XP_010625732.1 odorant-binding protein 2a-like [Fukomys damarensis]XP_010625733.1 odorant-binding protein 2a-like [Fukomys damarensis]XP_010625734.1 odorant-binding protein 2a-like [Fukomys damarensis]
MRDRGSPSTRLSSAGHCPSCELPNSLEMKTLTWTILLLSLLASLQAQDAEPERKNMEGIWYLKAMVANKKMPENMQPKKSYPVTLTALENGDYEVQLSFFYKDKCEEKTVEMHRTKNPKKFKTTQNMIISVEEMSVKDHIIFYVQHQMFGMPVRFAQLLARTPEENPEALREFKKFMKHKKLPLEHMVIPQQSDKCVS